MDRMSQYVSTLCMGYKRKVVLNESEGQPSFKKIHIVKEKDKNPVIDFSNKKHLLFLKCFNKEKKNERTVVIADDNNNNQPPPSTNSSIQNNKISETKMLFCRLCRKKHYIDGKDFGLKEDQICCSNSCVII